RVVAVSHSATHRPLPSFPTRRSSDLHRAGSPSLAQRTHDLSGRLIALVIALLVFAIFAANVTDLINHAVVVPRILGAVFVFLVLDRKSTRLNSSHVKIPYAVFSLKKQ